jgi:hypothetical protein
MNDDLHGPSLFCGIIITLLFLLLSWAVVNTYFTTFIPAYQEGYYIAYKQFRSGTIEQDVPRNIKLRFEIEMLKEKIK